MGGSSKRKRQQDLNRHSCSRESDSTRSGAFRALTALPRLCLAWAWTGSRLHLPGSDRSPPVHAAHAAEPWALIPQLTVSRVPLHVLIFDRSTASVPHSLFFFFKFYWTVVDLPCCDISAVQQTDSAIHVHTSILFQSLFQHRWSQNMGYSSSC